MCFDGLALDSGGRGVLCRDLVVAPVDRLPARGVLEMVFVSGVVVVGLVVYLCIALVKPEYFS